MQAAEAAGRDPSALRFPVGMLTVVDRDEERARRVAREVVCRLYHPVPHPYYDHLLRVQGYGAVADACEALVPHRRVDEAMGQVSDELIDRLTLAGTPEQCADRLRAYEGVADEVVLLNFTPESEPGAGDQYDALFETLDLAGRSAA